MDKTAGKNDACAGKCVSRKKFAELTSSVRPPDIIRKLAETFKALGDPTRTMIVCVLLEDELCVCDIAKILGAEQSVVSHQLRILRNMNLVKYRRDGRIIFYSLDDEHIKNLFSECRRHVEML